MSKISVFKFNINSNNINESTYTINSIMQSYLNNRRFYYNNEKKCFITAPPTKTNIATNIALTATTAVLSGGNNIKVMQTIQRGFEFQIIGNQLIIKAYLINEKNNSKQFIHSTFNNSRAASLYYSDLQVNLFKLLANNNIILTDKEIEKINDKSEAKVAKILIIYFIFLVVGAALAILLLFN